MKMPAEILTRLLRGEHFDMDERRGLGLWPPEALSYSEVLKHLCILLQKHEWFPREPIPSEAIYINRSGAGEFKCIVWPGQGAKSAERTFSDPTSAAEFYLKWELHLPGSLDGWPVVADRAPMTRSTGWQQ